MKEPIGEIRLITPCVYNRLKRFGELVSQHGRQTDWCQYKMNCCDETELRLLNKSLTENLFPQLNLYWLKYGNCQMLNTINEDYVKYLYKSISYDIPFEIGDVLRQAQPNPTNILRLISGNVVFSSKLSKYNKELDMFLSKLRTEYFSIKENSIADINRFIKKQRENEQDTGQNIVIDKKYKENRSKTGKVFPAYNYLDGIWTARTIALGTIMFQFGINERPICQHSDYFLLKPNP